MHRFGVFKADVLIDLVNFFGVPLLAIYFFSMFLYPWVDGRGSWIHVQATWDRWQSLNTGVLAFAASLLAFNISRFNANRQRERDFAAAKAFLPSTLSELVGYFRLSAQSLMPLWNRHAVENSDRAPPSLPTDYRETFANCIRHANPDVGNYLSKVLAQLQVHDSRMTHALVGKKNGIRQVTTNEAIIVYAYCVGELQVLVDRLFDFARNEGDFDDSRLTWDEFQNAYRTLGIQIDKLFVNDRMNLEGFTKRALSKQD